MADPRRLEAWNSPTLQDNIGTKDCMQQLNLITPFTGWLQQIHVHIRLQKRSPDKTWLLSRTNSHVKKQNDKVKLNYTIPKNFKFKPLEIKLAVLTENSTTSKKIYPLVTAT
ncbi:hypothetical protein DAPPUDRAFT_310854 [Daphnia pulex]|uniref:Uncharacterized protein n=1 Tax=Daphnia pulex TaxID=6669 RepID=E9FVT1_DAPPU|nr:hypothetical protein DAPPUDRAFT_310854 [Daphnia pulex]|eukprot:EFX88609.1 hypothetical protein DAPPUDRAFT_310854 [Daphnia pulex]